MLSVMSGTDMLDCNHVCEVQALKCKRCMLKLTCFSVGFAELIL